MMINILGVIAAVALAASAYLAYVNKGAYREGVAAKEAAQNKLEDLQGQITKIRNLIKEGQANSLEGKEQELVNVEKQVAAQDGVLAGIEESITLQKKEIAAKKEELANLAGLTGQLDEADTLIADVKKYSTEKNELDAELASLNTTRNSLDNSLDSLSATIAGQKQKVEFYSNGKSLPSLSSTVSRVYDGYGFVTLAGGDKAGIMQGSTLDVVRGGRTIAKVLVTTVESNSAAADIIPSSLEPGVSVRAGDRVIASAPLTAKAK